jgi:hypothetical protein
MIKSILILALFVTPILLIYIISKILFKEKWQKSLGTLNSLKKSEFEFFDNIEIQTSSYSRFKIIAGFPEKGTLYINNSRLVIFASNKPSLLFYSALPVDLSNPARDDSYVIKICNWKAISIILNKCKSGIGYRRVELSIELKNQADFDRLKESLKSWC